jgi:antitoxin MazE
MEAVIRKWGNSPALRLNQSTMKMAAFDVEQRVTITASKGRIIIEPAHTLEYQLDDLLAGMTPANTPGEVDFGAPQGKEAL